MLVFIDESGDPGFKIARGSSSHFVVAMVVFDDRRDAERTSAAIATCRDRLGVKPEFRFSKSSGDVRDRFFDGIAGCNFCVRAIVVDKARVYSGHLRGQSDHFYAFFVRQLLDHDGGRLVRARVKIDGSGDREFKRQLGTYLRQRLRHGQIEDFRYLDSRADNLLQLADMVAGAIRCAYASDNRGTSARWRGALQRCRHEEDVWEFR